MRLFDSLNRIQSVVLVIWALMVMTIPFHKVLSSPLLILSFLLILFSGDYARKWEALRSGGRWVLFAALYLIAVFGYFLSEHTAEALRDLNIKLYILLIPVYFTLFGRVPRQAMVFILRLFVLACLLFGIVALVLALYDYVTTGEAHFYYKYLVDFTFIHPSYIAMFMVFSMIILSEELIVQWSKMSMNRRLLYGAILLFFMLFVLLLTAKMAIASMFLALTIAFIVWGKKHIGWRKTAMVAIMGNIVLFLAMMALPYTRQRMVMLLHYNEVNYTNSVDSREEIWKAAMQLGRSHMLTGVGSGDAQALLIEQYRINGFETGVREKYNAHSAYLQVYVETGLIGLMAFLAFFAALLYLAWRDGHVLWGAFLLLFMINIATESMFKTQSGVVFFSFFNALLGLHFRRK